MQRLDGQLRVVGGLSGGAVIGWDMGSAFALGAALGIEPLALGILGADRWSEARWEDLASQFEVVETRTKAEVNANRLARQPQVRRVARSSYMG